MVRHKAVRVVASVLLAMSVAACGSSAETSDGDVETTTPRTETTATSVAEPTLSTSESEETEESAGGADSGGESTESEPSDAEAAEASSESSGSFIELLREDIEGQQEYFDLNSVGGSGESALLQAGCEVFGDNTWVCPDEVDLSGADLTGADPAILVGDYRREPVLNDWHEVQIELAGTALRWRNAAGVSWSLEIRDGVLWAGSDCPYGAQALQVGVDADGAVTGVYFGGQLYGRVGG